MVYVWRMWHKQGEYDSVCAYKWSLFIIIYYYLLILLHYYNSIADVYNNMVYADRTILIKYNIIYIIHIHTNTYYITFCWHLVIS